MKYRHACHAGNFADVTKHVALTAALLRLTEKPRPIFFLDTHAGRGRYDVAGAAEAERGIARLLRHPRPSPPPAIARYLDVIRSLNGGAAGVPRAYPGSPLVAAALLRATDRGALCELVPSEARALREALGGDRRFGVHLRDGFEALGALTPPREGRGLALIDPPYEEQERDHARVAEALAAAAARWPQGVLMAWYPIKLGFVAERLHRMLEQAGVRRVMVAELCVLPDDSRAGLNGSGLVTINPPWRLEDDLRACLPLLHAALAGPGAGRWRVGTIVGE